MLTLVAPYSLAPPTDPDHPNDHSLIEHRDDPTHPAFLIPELCRGFYTLGWVTGTGGGISIRSGCVRFLSNPPGGGVWASPADARPPTPCSDNVYLAPSGVQKEKIEPRDLFVLTLKERDFLRWPVHKPLKQSACTPLFYNAYDLRNAGACIHVRPSSSCPSLPCTCTS